MSSITNTKSFLEIADQFKLGHLQTESFHPKTANLSSLVKQDVASALSLLEEIDHDALTQMPSYGAVIFEMATSIQDTLKSGDKVFMCGCGATGRLSLVLETLYRQEHGPNSAVFSFMAGGDYALIKSVESFEDRTHYGERQLLELGFGPRDLLLAPTEGGETPFVIGATLTAAARSSRAPYFLYCNPDELLMPIERSREVLQDDRIKKVNLSVGPMAISGSTRMQASTVLMLAIGVGLLSEHGSRQDFDKKFHELLESLKSVRYQQLAPLTSHEAALYQQGKYVNYMADPELAISILTDTTERSPTFSLRGFENFRDKGVERSLAYLFVRGASESAEAWEKLLSRSPRALSWEELEGRIQLDVLLGFDISEGGLALRQRSVESETFNVEIREGSLKLACDGVAVDQPLPGDSLSRHLIVKMLLNAHSTAIMGLLGRYEGNVMTWVRSSNNKLIDRSARYTSHLLERDGLKKSYEEIVAVIFEEMAQVGSDEAVVLKALGRLKES